MPVETPQLGPRVQFNGELIPGSQSEESSTDNLQSCVERQNIRNLLELPAELLLLIAGFLDQDYHTLLRLSCSYLYHLLRKRHGFSVTTPALRWRFARVLQRDYGPQYVPCKRCSKMYRWRTNQLPLDLNRGKSQYCPCSRIFPFIRYFKWVESTPYPESCGKICSDIIELVFRAAALGPSYGIPISDLFQWSSWKSPSAIHYGASTKGRIVQQQFLYRLRLSVSFDDKLLSWVLIRIDSAFCQHLGRNIHSPSMLQLEDPIHIERDTTMNAFSERLYKCNFCATDCRFSTHRPSEGRVQMSFHRIMNFGPRSGTTLANRQIYESLVTPLDPATVVSRDLHALWDEGE